LGGAGCAVHAECLWSPAAYPWCLDYSIQRTQHKWPPASNQSRYHDKYHVIIKCVSFYCSFDGNVALLIITRYSNLWRPLALRNSFQSSFANTDFKEAVCIIKWDWEWIQGLVTCGAKFLQIWAKKWICGSSYYSDDSSVSSTI